ncbi:MAG: ATP-dependent DNA ligase [Solivirus sp.]|uniref:DNA ligase n=1 Tax=Solivirus sp. TaxID=2487772 RepID=A0A3G5AK00_9VIRU|nr:MAG: ATP-dependent DNA ligase [Solivirus sp.]
MTDNFASAAVAIHQIQTQSFQLPILYRIGSFGKIRVWFIVFNGTNLVSYWGTDQDYKVGQMQSSHHPITLNSSGRNLQEQALLEAQSRWKLKHDKEGYSEQIMSGTILTQTAILAKEWKPEQGIKRFPVWVQPKLDGVRCRVNIEYDESHEGSRALLISRNTMVITHFDHIRRDLERFFPIIQRVLTEVFPGHYPLFRLDGELYDQQVPFQLLNGMSRTSANKVVSEKERLVKYHIFDLIVARDLTYDERMTLLHRAYSEYSAVNQNSSLLMVNPFQVNSIDEIKTKHDEFVQLGYEGIIIRYIGGRTEAERKISYHKSGRSVGLLKYKNFKDDEGLIIGAKPATGDEQGAIVWCIQAKNGAQFWCRPKGDIEGRIADYQKWVATNGQAFLGQMYRYEFQELTDAGVPRFPRGVGFIYDRNWKQNEEEDED